MRSPWAAAHGREPGRYLPSTVCLFSAALCWTIEVDMLSVRLPVRKWACRLRALSYTVPHRRRASRTPSAQLPRGFRAFPDLFRDVVRNASGPSARFPDAFEKFRDTFRGAEAFGTTSGRCRRFQEGADVVTMTGRQYGQDADGERKFISASKFCSRPKIRRGNFLMSGSCGNTRKGLGMTVCGGYQEYAERLRIFNFYFPHVVRALVDAQFYQHISLMTSLLTQRRRGCCFTDWRLSLRYGFCVNTASLINALPSIVLSHSLMLRSQLTTSHTAPVAIRWKIEQIQQLFHVIAVIEDDIHISL